MTEYFSSDDDDDLKKNVLVKTTPATVNVAAKKQIKTKSRPKLSTQNAQNQKNKV